MENQEERREHVLELCLTDFEFPLELKIFELWTDLLKTVRQVIVWKLVLQHDVNSVYSAFGGKWENGKEVTIL